MADSLLIILNRNDIGSPVLWNSLLSSESIEVKISEDFDPLSHDGFIQCTYEGKRAGFEFELSTIGSFDFEQQLTDRFPQESYVVSLTPREGHKSALAATSIAAAISALADGKILEEDDVIIEGAKSILLAQQSIHEYKNYEISSSNVKNEVCRIKTASYTHLTLTTKGI